MIQSFSGFSTGAQRSRLMSCASRGFTSTSVWQQMFPIFNSNFNESIQYLAPIKFYFHPLHQPSPDLIFLPQPNNFSNNQNIEIMGNCSPCETVKKNENNEKSFILSEKKGQSSKILSGIEEENFMIIEKDFAPTHELSTDVRIQKWTENLSSLNYSEEGRRFQYQIMKKIKSQEPTYFCGNFKESLAYGKGIIYQPNKKIIYTHFVNGEMHGDTEIHDLAETLIIKGFHINRNLQGQFTIEKESEFKFTGIFSNGQVKDGRFEYTDKAIKSMDVDFVNKKCRIIYINNNEYCGEIKGENFWEEEDLIPHGIGTMTYSQDFDQAEYIGDWDNGYISGNGKMRWRDGSTYEGQFQQGKRHGKGKFIKPNGSIFEGTWQKSKLEGIVEYYQEESSPPKILIYQNGNKISDSSKTTQDNSHQIIKKDHREKKEIDKPIDQMGQEELNIRDTQQRREQRT